jgi:uridine phosphorylase
MEEAIIKPHRRPDDPAVPEAVVLIPDPFSYFRATRHLEGLHSEVHHRRIDFFHLFWPEGAKESWTLAGPALGSPAAVLALEKLIALGAREILLLGPCGSLIREAPIGTVVVPKEALSEEGTSRLYGADPARPIPVRESVRRRLEDALTEAGFSYLEGSVWTTDAPYRETQEKVEGFRGQGAVAVEMELSACLAAGAFRGATVAGLFVVSDELLALEWVKGFDNPSFVATFQRIVDNLPDLLGSLRDEA